MRTKFLAAVLSMSLLLAVGCSKKAEEQATQSAQAPAGEQSATNQQGQQEPQAPVVPATIKEPEPEPLVVPAGTTLAVRLGAPLSSKSSKPGETFPVTISTPIKVGGKTAIPAGANGMGQVLDAKKQGAFKGEAALAVTLTSITVDGHSYPVQTSAFMQQVKGKGKRTAKAVGGGAGAGALIGGIAGGGKGAAIGALVGAGAGTAVAAGTGGENVNLPAEAIVSFKLSNSVTIPQK
jgi:hypothetical protein